MKNTYTLILIVIPSICFSQNFSQREIKRLNSFKIDVNAFVPNATKDYMNLSTILEKDRKYKSSKIIGIVFAVASAYSIVSGIVIYVTRSNGNVNYSGEDSFYGAGVIAAGISVPFLISSKRRKKERDVLIKFISN